MLKQVRLHLVIIGMAALASATGCIHEAEFYEARVELSERQAIEVCGTMNPKTGATLKDAEICRRGMTAARTKGLMSSGQLLKTRVQHKVLETGVELGDLERYRPLIAPRCQSIAKEYGTPGAFSSCMVGGLELVIQLAQNICGVDITAFRSGQTQFCLLKREWIKQP